MNVFLDLDTALRIDRDIRMRLGKVAIPAVRTAAFREEDGDFLFEYAN